MRWRVLVAAAVALGGLSPTALAQKGRNEEDFVKEKPAVGEMLPDVTVYTPDGKELKTGSLRGHYTVLTFGCLT